MLLRSMSGLSASVVIFCGLLCASVCATSLLPAETSTDAAVIARRPKVRNFISTDALLDGEQERRLHFNGITAKETSVMTASPDDKERVGIKLLQITDGLHFIQLIYGDNGGIRDCEFIRQKKIVRDFLESFRKDIDRAQNYKSSQDNTATDEDEEDYSGDAAFQTDFRNVTFQLLEPGATLPGDLAKWMDYEALKQQCKLKHREIRQLIRHKEHGTEVQKKQAQEHIERYKRGLAEMLIAPGTKWCGHRRLADRYAQLGPFSVTDRCCRRHDHCPIAIPGLGEKYNLLNFRPFTISHCGCDQSFRTCLKMSGTGAANIVGKLFFNIVQAKCFVLKPEKVCVKQSWWSKCEKYEYKKRAYLRDNVPY